MQMTKFKPLFNYVTINKERIRTLAVASTTVKSDTNLKSWREIPGPTSLPIIGQMHHFMPGGHLRNIKEDFMKLFELYGPIVRLDGIFGIRPIILLSDPECSAQVYRGENQLPIRPAFPSLNYYKTIYKKNIGNTFSSSGLPFLHGEAWKELRLTVNPIMLQPKTIKQYSTVLDEIAQDMITRMKANRDENKICKHFDKEIYLWSLESIGLVALGCRLNCFDRNLPADSPEWQLIQCVHDMFTIVNELDYEPSLWRYFPTPMYKKAMKLYEHQENLVKHFIEKRKEQLKNKSDNEKSVLEKLLAINDETAHTMAIDMIIGGVDSTATAVTSTLYLLAKHPEKQDKLREEILSKSEQRPYLRACIKESLRIMPVFIGNTRETTKEYNLMGFMIPKDIQIIFVHQHMSLMEENYPRAREYIPERWLASKDDPLYYRNAHPFASAPFGFGTRNCIGRRIAELEMDTFIALLIENFQVEWLGPPPTVHFAMLSYIKGPYNFVFKDL